MIKVLGLNQRLQLFFQRVDIFVVGTRTNIQPLDIAHDTGRRVYRRRRIAK